MATLTFFDKFKSNFGKKIFNLSTDTFKIYLTNSSPQTFVHAVKADIAGLAATNGYAELALVTTWAETGTNTNVYRFACTFHPNWTASGGNFGPFAFGVLYDDTPTSPADPLIGYFDFGGTIEVTDGNSFIITLDENFTLFQLT